MGCKECGKPKCNGECGCKSPKVLQINNPAEYITFHKVSIPAAMGDSTTNPPKIGAYRNALVYYEADHTSWMYSTDGIPTLVTGEQGPTGPQGPAGTITVGTTTTGDTGTDAEVENVGTPENAILNFTIPRGEQGDQGPQGEPGPQGYMNEQDVRDVVDTIIPEGFFDDESTVSDCGTSFELENLAGGSPKSLRLNGDTFQQTYTGKNCIGFQDQEERTVNGLTYSVKDGIVTVNGTATSTTYTDSSTLFNFKEAGDITLSIEILGGTQSSSIIGFQNRNSQTAQLRWQQVGPSSDLKNTKAIDAQTISDTTDIRLYMNLGSVFNNFKFRLMAEYGSTATDYEPYVGGQPSPSPEYPQQIQTVTGTQTISINGTNYPISLGSLELCKLGTYQDYIWKDGDDWKVHKATVSAIIDGSESWDTSGTNTFYVANIYSKIGNSIQSASTGEMYASHFTIVDITSSNTLVGASLKVDAAHNVSNLRIRLQDMSGGTAGFKQMLSAKKPSIYVRRLTPNDTVITDQTLIAHLEAIRLDAGANAISISSDGLSGEICLEAFIGNWKGTISELKNADERLEEKLGNLPYGDKSQSVVYAFFNEANDGTFDFYTSEDGIELQKLNVEHTLTGRDPAPFFKNGKWYVASTSYNYVNGYDFAIRVSDDLNNWTLHNISVGLTEQDYPKVWAPEWFEDDDGKIYIILSKMYANTEGWGDFHPYIVECTDLENLTFGAPQQMILNGSTSDNHIDGAIAKYNGTYHLIIKSDHQSELYLEHYTSADLVNWTLQDVDPMRFGRTVEGPFIYKRDGYYYIGAERYSTRPMELSYYIMCKTKDFVTYSPCEDISFPDADVSHGSGIVVDNAEINKLLNTGLVTKESGSKVISEIPVEKDFDVVATRFADLSVSPNVRLGAYLHMFDIKAAGTYHNGAVIFHISTVFGTQVDATYKLNYYNANSSITDVKFSESDCLTADIHEPMSVAGSMFAIKKPNDPTVLQVFLETDRITKTNQRLDIKFISTILDHAQIIKYVDDFVDSVPDGETKHYARGSAKSQSVNLDNRTHPYVRIIFGSYNGGIRLYGHENSLTNIHRLVDAMILVNNGGGAIHHLNSEYDGNIDITVENYTSSDTDRKREYQILISGIPTSSALTFTLPNNMYSYIKKVQYLDSI